MSRSKRPRCSRGRSCGVCLDPTRLRYKAAAEHGIDDLHAGLTEATDRGEGDGYYEDDDQLWGEPHWSDIYEPSPRSLTVSLAEACL